VQSALKSSFKKGKVVRFAVDGLDENSEEMDEEELLNSSVADLVAKLKESKDKIKNQGSLIADLQK